MAFCQNCGSAMQDGAKFCPSCGRGVGSAQPNMGGVQAQSASNDTLMGVLAYLWLLVLIPIFAAKDSAFVRYHANQGLVLAIFATLYTIVTSSITSVLFWTSWQAMSILSTIFWIGSLAFFALAIVGIVNVVNGKQSPLPVIGGITILK